MKETCAELRESLLDFADGRATGTTRSRVETHLDDCEACRRLLARLGAPPALPALVAPPFVLDEIQAGIHRRLDALEEKAPRGLLAWLFQGALPVPKPLAWAMVILVLVLSTDRLRPVHEQRSPVPAVLMDGVDHLAPLMEADRG